MQYLSPVGIGPSLNTWPRCASHFAHLTSILFIPNELSSNSLIKFSSLGKKKLGQPQPESNLVSDWNNSWPQQIHL